jgi:hypothetical protein
MSTQDQVQQPNDKEYNFRVQEARFKARLEEVEAEKRRLQQELETRNKQNEVEEDDPEPYVDHKKLDRKLAKHGQNTQSEIQKAMEYAKQTAKEELKQEMWLENNPDFNDTLKHAERFAIENPQLADTILKMPQGFEREKMVYQMIKRLGTNLPEKKVPSIQETIDANRKSPYYQPSGVGTAPYNTKSDFSQQGQKDAYNKMQELKNRLRLG